MEYFRLCVRYQDPSARGEQEQRGILNNSHENNIPQELQWADEWNTLLSVYLRAKFAYLAAFERAAPLSRAAIAATLGVEHCETVLASGLDEVEGFWRRMADLETHALLLRLEQLPDQVVLREWYVDCEEFHEWANAALRRHNASAEQSWRDLYAADYRRLLTQHPRATGVYDEPEVRGWRAVTDIVYSRANALTNAVSGHILGFAELPSDVGIELGPKGEMILRGNGIVPDSINSGGRLVAEVATSLLNEYGWARKPLPAAGELMKSFTVAVAKAADCVFCDFLVWDEDVLRPQASSSPNADLAKLMRFPYRKAEGISGSAVLVPRDAPRRWVGTNDFANDPRGSLRHADAYQGEVGPIADYWLFPVFAQGPMPVGAFRVVNRTTERHRAGVPWSHAILNELQSLALWFESELLPHMDGLSGHDDQRVAQHASDAAHGGAIQVLRSGCDLNWIDNGFFAELIAHMCSVAFRRVEKTSLGCCIGLFEERNFAAVFDLLQSYKAVAAADVTNLEAASALYPRVSPSAGMFMFRQQGGPGKVVSLQSRSPSTALEKVQDLTRDRERAAVLILERGQDCVRIVARGDVVADYYMSDAAGTWTPRIYEPLLQVVLGSRPPTFHENTVRQVFRLATDLSYMRIGAMAILADELPPDVSLVGGDGYDQLILENLSRDIEAADLARVDGAIQINSAGAVTRCGAFVRRNVTLDEEPERLFAAGSRHRAGEDLSSLAPDALVFVVSENRPLTIFKGGSKVLDGV